MVQLQVLEVSSLPCDKHHASYGSAEECPGCLEAILEAARTIVHTYQETDEIDPRELRDLAAALVPFEQGEDA